MDVELRQLRALVAVVDEGSFTAAGRALRTSQASVSRAVAALERAVGAPLLHRTTRRLALTATGEQVIGPARRVLADVAAIGRAASGAPAEIRVGYAWAALGAHTLPAQQRWAAAHPGSALRFTHVPTPTAGLGEGLADLAVLRRDVPAGGPGPDALASVLVGVEPRVAAVAATDPLARRRSVALADVAGRTVGVDPRTGTTTLDLWPTGRGPAATREVEGVEDWLTMIAAGEVVGLTAIATAHHHRRPGVVFRPVRDAPPVAVRLAWRRATPPPQAGAVVALLAELYGTAATPPT